MGRFSCDYYSVALKREITLQLLIPTALPGDSKQPLDSSPFPVLYFAHGSGNDGTTAIRYSSLERYSQENQLAVVLFSHEDKATRNVPCHIPDYSHAEAGHYDNFEDFVQYELPEFVSSYFPISFSRDDSYIAGLSQGGYIALLTALSRPDRYKAVGVFSGMFFSRPRLAEMARLPANVVEGLSSSELEKHLFPEFEELVKTISSQDIPKLFFSRGAFESSIGIGSDLMAKKMREYGADVHLASIQPYGHEWDNWDAVLKEFIAWLPRTDKYATRTGVCNGLYNG